jgi:hypothetical protein
MLQKQFKLFEQVMANTKAASYQLFFNLKRPNSYKEHQTPLQLALEKKPDLDQHLLRVPPMDLDKLLRMKNPLIRQGLRIY